MLSAFPALEPQRHGAHTALTGLLDRSALDLELLEVRQLKRKSKSPESGDGRSPC